MQEVMLGQKQRPFYEKLKSITTTMERQRKESGGGGVLHPRRCASRGDLHLEEVVAQTPLTSNTTELLLLLQAAGTYPTGMHCCLSLKFNIRIV